MLMLVKAVWVRRMPDGRLAMDTASSSSSAEGTPAPFVLTNDADAMRQLLADVPDSPLVLDAAELFRIVLPGSQAESIEQRIASVVAPETAPAAGLWQAWQAVDARLAGMPLWALETMELLLRELGETASARLLGRYASNVRLAGKNCGPWRDSFASESLRQTRRHVPVHADCSPLDADAVAAMLQPGSPLARKMPGYEPRAGQIEMLRAVVRAFNAPTHLLVEAGTGVGKSVAYLLPAALWARRNDVPVIVSTNTRNLQSQLLEKDLPLVRQVVEASGADKSGRPGTGSDLRVALIKGRANYLCLRRLGALLEHGQFELDRSGLRAFLRTVAWAVQTRDGDLDDLSGSHGMDAAFLLHLGSLVEECPGRGCRHFRRCFLQRARDRAMQAHVIIANHALVFAEMSGTSVALPPAGQIIFDEAHNLEEAATRHFSVEVTPARLAVLLRRLTRGGGKQGGGVLDTLRRQIEKGGMGGTEDRRALLRLVREAATDASGLQSVGMRLFRALHAWSGEGKEPRRFRRLSPEGPPTFLAAAGASGTRSRNLEAPQAAEDCAPVPEGWLAVTDAVLGVREAADRVHASMQALAAGVRQTTGEDELALHEDVALDLEAAAAMVRAFVQDVEFALAGSDAEHVFWVQPARSREKLAEVWAAPLRIGPRLETALYAVKSSVVFCSATLRVGGSFAFVAGRLGVDRIPPERLATCVATSPFDYPAQCAVLAPIFLPEPGADGRAYAEQLSGLMLEVVLLTRGRALGLFTSYEMMRLCAGALRDPLAAEGIRLLMQGEGGSRDQITRVFRNGGACVLLGTHSFWEGVDVVGDALSCVILARLPFAAVGDPIQEARCEQVEAEGGQGFMNFSLPNAVIRFRQGFGRLIRHRGDRGVVIVADPRVVTRRYASRFRASLPCEVETMGDRDTLLARVEHVLAPAKIPPDAMASHGSDRRLLERETPRNTRNPEDRTRC